jgi:hypothetical protein
VNGVVSGGEDFLHTLMILNHTPENHGADRNQNRIPTLNGTMVELITSWSAQW